VRIGLVGGTGKEGHGLSERWRRAGHDLVIGSRDPTRGDNRAAARCDVAVICVPYAAHAATLRELAADLAGRLVIDLVVPLAPPQITRVALPPGGAAALEARAILGDDARIVAALHHVSSVHLSDPDRALRGDVLVCGDGDGDKQIVCDLIGDLGMRAVDAGPLGNAIALEAMTPVLLYMNRRYRKAGLGLSIAGLEDPG
jgi:8-hydroxy-5-deazaflavin:NADPH oxidoreductase